MAARRPASRHLGLDLGGTNSKWVVAQENGGEWQILDRGQVATPAVGGPEAVATSLAQLGTEAVEKWPGIGSAGVGVPGLYDPREGTTRFLVNLPGEWAGFPVGPRLSNALGLPVRLVNDARAFGLAELRLGAGRGASSMVGLTMGTGLGGVIALDGVVYQGHDGTGGELGHQTIEPDGPWCGCGNRGCLEAFVRADQIAAACGAATAEEAVGRARAGEAQATAGMAQVGRYLGIGVANIVTVLTPDRVVIGGGISAALDLLTEHIWEQLRLRVRTTSLEGVEIVPAELGIWAGGIGAALHGAEAPAEESEAAEAPAAGGVV